MLDNALNGYNAALFAYGQTGSGKSYSITGYGANKGIVPIMCTKVFERAASMNKTTTEFQVTFSMLEIYNERVRDLLSECPTLSARNFEISGIGYLGNSLCAPTRSRKPAETSLPLGRPFTTAPPCILCTIFPRPVPPPFCSQQAPAKARPAAA